MAPSVEVDLTSETPPKKMKQARLPFAPVNKQVSKDVTESGRKRKHSEEETVTPNKNPKKDAKSPIKAPKENLSNETKNKLASFANDNQENNPDGSVDDMKETSEIKALEEVSSSKKKASKAKKEKDAENKSVEGPEKFKGLLKMPFKKSKKGVKESKAEINDDIEIVEEPSEVDKSSIETPTEETSMTSMTEEWAKFHENRDTADESMEEVETSQTESDTDQTPNKSSKKKTKAEKEKEKEEKLKLKLEDKTRKEEEKAKVKTEKEKRKSILKEEKAKVKKEKTPRKGKLPNEVQEKEPEKSEPNEVKEEVIKQKPSKEEVQAAQKKENTPAKVNPLAKFLVKAKGGDIKPKPSVVIKSSVKKTTNVKEVPKKCPDDDIEVIKEVNATQKSPAPATSTPLRTSPRKKVSMSRTPSTPFTPDPDRAKKLSVAKLKVKISELNMVMDKAVEEKDFLKAHETKQAIQKLEEEIKEIDADTSYVSQSLADVSGVPSSADNTPKVTPNATPKNCRNVSMVSTPGSTNGTPSMFKKLTPGQLLKQEEMKKKREALEKDKLAKKEALENEKQVKKDTLEKEKQTRKEALEKEKADKERQREVEKRAKEVERLEKERLRKTEKEKLEAEKDKQKQEKEEERLKKKAEKEAELKQKEVEKLKKEEEKRLLEEDEKEKAKKKVQAFKSFFKKEDTKERKLSGEEDKAEEVGLGNFTLFRVKENMRLAPTVRNNPEMAKRRIDSLDMPAGPDDLYLALLKTKYIPGKQTRTWPYEKNDKKDDDIEILEDEEEEESDPEDNDHEEENANIIIKGALAKVPRAKLLQFHANQRPAFWGTWTKKTKYISGRRPFGRDEDRFEYDYDSDEDWEEEEEGESLSDNEDDKEKEEEKDDYEVDNEFFVPHGYLSDEEEEKDEDEVFNPETAKEKLKHAEKEFEKEHKKKTQQLKPRLWGVHFEGEILDTGVAASQLVKILGGFQGIVVGNNNCIETGFSKPVMSPSAIQDEVTKSAKVKNSSKGAKAKTFPEEAVPDLIKLLHGNANNKMFLAREFLEFWKKNSGEDGSVDSVKVEGDNVGTPGGKEGQGTISKRLMVEKIQEIADYKRQADGGVRCWWVKDDFLTKYSVTTSIPSEWSYILEQPNNKNSTVDELNASRPGSPSIKVAPSPNPASLITKFARVLTEEEKEEQRIKQEKEALLARLKREAAKAEQADKEAKLKAEHAASAASHVEVVPVAKPSPAGAMSKFAKVLSAEERKASLAQGSPTAGKKRAALTSVSKASPIAVKRTNSTPLSTMSPGNSKRATLTPVARKKKTNPIASLAADKDLTSPQTKIASPINIRKTPSIASPILVKKTTGPASPAPSKKGLKISTPDAINAKASPIAIKRKPGPKAATPLSFKGKIGTKIPPGVTVTSVRSSPRKKVVECVTLD